MKYLRILEHERDLVEQGRQEERSNTERERIRADAAEKELQNLRRELELLRAGSQ